MKSTKPLQIAIFISLLIFPSSLFGFIKTNGEIFIKDGKPYYYIGTNFWYGSILASKGTGGNRERLIKELDLMKQTGIDNLRILIGAEGPDNEPTRVTPTLQQSPGVYNDTILDGLDFLLSEMQKRGQVAILYLQNAWDWSGGYSQYLNWNGYGKIPYPGVKPNTWSQFINYSQQFYKCSQCREQFREYIKFILTRTNRYTHIKYTDDPTIMTWEVANEPRAFNQENIPLFVSWLSETSAYIKSIDKNHMVTLGSEGLSGCENSYELFEKIQSDTNVDYCTIHIWPKNWSWIDIHNIPGTVDEAIVKTNDYLNKHMAIAQRLNKPLVLEEFGLPRDKHGYSFQEPTSCRDKYYKNAFQYVLNSSRNHGVLAGCNFWAWGGFGRSKSDHIFWIKNDDYLGDPPQEEQGLNSVFNTDSTISLIRETVSAL